MDAEVSRRLLLEARAVARLNHQNIVRVLEAGTQDGVAFMATEYIEGESLGNLLRRGERLSISVAADLIRQLADAAHHAHAHGVLHRDIKPDNILLDETSPPESTEPANFVPRLTDFGLAKTTDGGANSISGLVVGTPNYMAPEQAAGDNQNHGPFTDVFSLSVVLYELLIGKRPADRLFRSLRRQRPEIPRDLESICLRCVESDITKRYATSAALQDDLERFLDGRPTVARPLPLHEQLLRWCRQHPTALTLFLTIMSCMVVVCGVIWNSARKDAVQNRQLTTALDEVKTAQQTLSQNEHRFRELAWTEGMKRAYGQFERSDYTEAQRTLDELKSVHADAVNRAEWILAQQELSERFQVLLDVGYPLHDLVAIPRTTRFAAVGEEPYVHFFDSTGSETPECIAVDAGNIHAVDASPDGQTIAVGGAKDGAFAISPLLLDVPTKEICPSGIFGPTTVESLAFSPDGSQLAAGFRYEGIRIAKLPSDRLSAVRHISAERRNRAVVWLNCRRIVSHRDIDTLEISAADDKGETQQIVRADGFETFRKIPGQDLIVAATYRGRGDLEVIETAEGRTTLKLIGLKKSCHDIAVSDDGRFVAAAYIDGRIAFWSVSEDALNFTESFAVKEVNPLSVVHVHDGPVTGLSWMGESVVSVGQDGRIVRTNVVVRDTGLQDESEQVLAACFLPQSDRLLLGFRDGAVMTISAANLPTVGHGKRKAANAASTSAGELVMKLGQSATAVAVSADGGTFAIGTLDGNLHVVAAKEPGEVILYSPLSVAVGQSRGVSAIRFSPRDQRVFWIDFDQHVHSEDITRPDGHWHARLPSECSALAVSPNCDVVMVGGNFEGVRSFAAIDGQLLADASRTRSLATQCCDFFRPAVCCWIHRWNDPRSKPQRFCG